MSDHSDLRVAALEARIAQLEQRGRRSWLALTVVALATLAAAQVASVQAQSDAQTLTVKAPFRVVDGRGMPMLVVEGGSSPHLDVIAQDRVVARLGGSADDAFLALSKGKDSARIGVDFDGAGTGPTIRLNGADGPLLDVSATGVNVKAPLSVSVDDTRLLDVKAQGVTATGPLTVTNATGTEIARIAAQAAGAIAFTVGDRSRGGINAGVAASGNGYFRLATREGKRGIDLGTSPDSALGLYVFGSDDTRAQASLGLDSSGKGILRVGDPTGARGVLGPTKSGGVSFGLFDQAGPDYRVGLFAGAEDSFVRLKAKGNAVHMNADGNGGAVHIFNRQGSAAASMQSTSSGYGKLSLGDSDGDTMVEAGTTADGLGVVRVGPAMGGPVNLPGLPFAILGKHPR
jgi:hypothetical protein